MRGDLLINFNEKEKTISRGKISTTKMKETRDIQVTKITEGKIKESIVKDSTESKELSSRRMRNQKKEETTTKKTKDPSKESHGTSESSGKRRANSENIKNIKKLVINLKGGTTMSVTISEGNKNGFKKM